MIDEYIGNLNSRLGSIEWQPILYQYAHLSFNELVALYTACDLALITPLRDGMNLVSKEFVASRKDKQGVLVLSEIAGAAEELSDALLINPNDTAEIAEMIKYGLDMSADEQRGRIERMQDKIKAYDVTKWADDFFDQLEKVRHSQLEFEVKFIDSFTKLEIANAYTNASKRLILLDYDGSLVRFHQFPHLAVPPETVINTLSKLAEDETNDVYIVSGRDSISLAGWLGHLPIGLVTEHGGRIRNKVGDWHTDGSLKSINWMQDAASVMEKYISEIPQSFIERKNFGIAWHYRNVSSPQVENKAKQLYAEMKDYAHKNGLTVLNGHKVIEVKSAVFDKGTATQSLLSNNNYDFILAVGDDETDEAMFKKLALTRHAFTIKVGSNASFAKYNLHNPDMVLSLLDAISNARQAV